MTQDTSKNEPEIIIDPAGNVVWHPVIHNYNPDLFYRGKTVTNREFNDLFIKQSAQSNYTARTLSEVLSKYLNTIIGRKFENDYKLVNSYVLEIDSEEAWGEKQADDYYYIHIPAITHGFLPAPDAAEKGINIDTELYLRDPDSGEYYEVLQIYTDLNNNVTLYTDDPRTVGVAVIRTNERSYSLSGTKLTTYQITDIAEVARTNSYNTLFDKPDLTGITTNATDIENIRNGTIKVKKAESADESTRVTGYIKGIAIDDILHDNTYVVKKAMDATNAVNATNAINATNADNATNATYAQYASTTTSKGTIEARLNNALYKSNVTFDASTGTLNITI